MCNTCNLEHAAFKAKMTILHYYLHDHFTAYEIAIIMAVNPSTVGKIIEENVL